MAVRWETSRETMGREAMDGNVSPALARALGWFGIGLGLVEMLAPDRLAGWIGVEERPALIRALGAREIANGVALLAQPGNAAWAKARVAGDVMDLALLGGALRGDFTFKARASAATAAVAAVTALDLIASRKLSARGTWARPAWPLTDVV